MPILTKEVEVKVNPKTVKHYESLGYKIPMKKASDSYRKRYKKGFQYDFGKTIVVKVEDLTKGSNVDIEILCDNCKKNKMIVPYDRYCKYIKETGSYVCTNCIPSKRSKTIYDRYGVYNISELSEYRKKACDTTKERYGSPYYTQTEEYAKRRLETMQTKYGVNHNSQLPDYREKYDKTCCERYGEFYHKQFAEKAFETFHKRSGYKFPSQSPKVKKKISQSFYENGTTPTSRQQLYIFNLYNKDGNFLLNYPISYYNVDICIPEEKLVIEYDGGFHDGQVKIGNITQEEHNQKEIIRNNIIKREGYKQMRIISTKDLLPQDSTLLQMLSEAKEYFSNYPNHSWIEFNIDTSALCNAEHKDGVYYDFGELRTIKESDFIKSA